MHKKIVMQDIADRLQLSKNSVSQALTGKDGVSEETRRLIMKTAQEMGYNYKGKISERKSAPARRIGLIASEYAFSMENFFGKIYIDVEREAQKHNFNLQIQSISPAMRDGLTLPAFLADNKVDGLLVLSHISTPYIERILRERVPTVLIDHHHPTLHTDAILTNNRFGAYMAVKHLLDLGHTKIGIIGNVDASPSYQERYEGYLLALREHGIKPSESLMYVRVPEEASAIQNVLQQAGDTPTAWFGMNDGFAFYVCNALHSAGRRIPEDISICGFDHTHFSDMCHPKLTTMEIDIGQFARKALHQLMWRMDNPDEVYQEILLPTRLLPRDSTGPVRKR